MKRSDLFFMAIQNLKNRKTRTILTIIGVIIGTCSIVIMVSIGVGIDKTITSQYDSSATLSKIAVYGAFDEDGNDTGMQLDDSAVEHFRTIKNVKAVFPCFDASSYVEIKRGKYTYNYSIKAVDFDLMKVAGYTLNSGAFENADKRNNVFFGENAVTGFYDSQGNSAKYKYDENYKISESEIDYEKDSFTISPKIESYDDTGAVYTVQSTQFSPKKIKCAGVIKNDNSIDYDSGSAIYIDKSYALELMKQSKLASGGKKEKFAYSEINVYVDGLKNVPEVKKSIQDLGFSCNSDDESLERTKKVMKVVQLILGAIGAVSMFVAAFGISNTMVMSVYERTKEIGIMKVLGCNIKDIKALFLYEAGTIGLIGGSIGMIISYILSITANIVARAVAKRMELGDDITVCVSSIPIWLAALGILFSLSVGVIAGLAPARRSVKVSALTAIHNE